MSVLFKDVLALDGFMNSARPCDILVNDGKIKQICEPGTFSGLADENLEGRGRLAVLPGFVNGHTHAAMSLLRGLGEEKPLMEWLREQIWPIEAKLTPEHIYWGTRLALLEMASKGVTCFGDMYFEMDQVARAATDMGMRAGLCRGLIGDDRSKLEENAALFREWNGRDGLISIQLGPHAPYTVSPDMLKAITAMAREIGAGVHFHFLEAEWEKQYLSDEFRMSPSEYLEETGLASAPFLILAHCVWFPLSEMIPFKDRNITLCHNVKSNLKLGSGIFPLDEAYRLGINISLGSDGAASNNQLDIWDEMKTAALLHKGVNKDPTLARASDILRMATYGGAHSLGFHKTGRILEQWDADLAIVDLDQPHYVGVDPDNLCCFIVYAGSSADVKSTMVKGKWIYRDNRFYLADRDEIIRQSLRCRKELVDQSL